MTNDMEWKIAKWLHKHGTTKRSNIPAWFPMDLTGKYRYFHVLQNPDKDGYLVVTDTDEFVMLDGDLDAFKMERNLRIYKLRDWIVPTTSIAAIIISVIALVVAIFSLLLQTQ